MLQHQDMRKAAVCEKTTGPIEEHVELSEREREISHKKGCVLFFLVYVLVSI